MKRLLFAVLGITVGGTAALLWLARDPRPKVKLPDARYSGPAISTATVKMVQDYTVLIANESMDSRWRGSGVLLSSTSVLTCAHIIPEDKRTDTLWIYPYPGAQVVHAKLKFINKPRDLALLELTTPVPGHTTPVLAKAVVTGEPMVSVGNIRGYMMWFASYGIVSGEHDKYVLSDAMIRGGNSGGPWANAKGEIIALTSVGWEDRENGSAIAGGIPTQEIQRFLAESKKKKPSAIYALTGD